MKHLEQDHRLTFHRLWNGWINTIQPDLGGTVGIPDIMIMPYPPQIVPIEAKRGNITNGRLFPDRIRPNQVQWHTTFALAKGKSWFYIGTPEERLFMVEAMLVLATRPHGLIVGSTSVHELDTRSSLLFTSHIRAIVE